MPIPSKDLTHQVFGKLTALDCNSSGIRGRLWRCQCECGKIVEVPAPALNSNQRKSCGCARGDNLEGMQFGDTLVLHRVGRWHNQKLYQCRCKCGEEFTRSSGKLKECHSCRKCANKRVGRGKRLAKGESCKRAIIASYKSNAEKRGHSFDITDADVVTLLAGDCHYCNTPPSRTFSKKGSYGSFTYNGIDRLNNDLGYTAENVVSCCTDCNYRKGQLSFEDFKNWIDIVSQTLEKRE